MALARVREIAAGSHSPAAPDPFYDFAGTPPTQKRRAVSPLPRIWAPAGHGCGIRGQPPASKSPPECLAPAASYAVRRMASCSLPPLLWVVPWDRPPALSKLPPLGSACPKPRHTIRAVAESPEARLSQTPRRTTAECGESGDHHPAAE